MAVGKVKWFNNAKGFGFINTDAREGKDEDGHTIDFFAHYSAIEMDGYRTLKAGQPVNFEIVQGPKGLHAVKITAAPVAPEPANPATHHDHHEKVSH
ncbi:cold shock domain-containing protein [Pseudomonas frederiksbergensis]|uniref:DNA-binding protein n=1 Tax=Pseudomonas frederiksbergensis TaxID=104087 RepID=A0A423KBD1_9PSED|nr:cold shock domain-containing protein [Pseudomonas frederiksbergensis]RON49397.1 DNA-binding protein [Pseudomonas frederiksbergensis]RON57757.1 DNA-binding protein [Pseudomonas frederiksbergensis]